MSITVSNSEIKILRIVFFLSVIISFVLGVFVGMKTVQVTSSDAEYQEPIEDISAPIGKLTPETAKSLKLFNKKFIENEGPDKP